MLLGGRCERVRSVRELALGISPPTERGVAPMVEPPAPTGPDDSLPRGGPDSSSQWVGFWRDGVVSSVASEATSDLEDDSVEKDGRYELVEVFGTRVTYALKDKVLLPTAASASNGPLYPVMQMTDPDLGGSRSLRNC